MLPASGDPCDTCEATQCCKTLSACYDDPTCSAADDAKDACENQPPDAGVAACWDAFQSSGPLAVARHACLAANCKMLCLP
jgi:hypothetical protein